MAHDTSPVKCTVASLIAKMLKCSREVTLGLLCLLCSTLCWLPYGAGCHWVRRTAHSAPSPAALPAPSPGLTRQNGFREGEIGYQHNYGRRWVQQIDRAHSIEQGENVYSVTRQRSKRYQPTSEGKVCAMCWVILWNWNYKRWRLSTWIICIAYCTIIGCFL